MAQWQGDENLFEEIDVEEIYGDESYEGLNMVPQNTEHFSDDEIPF